MADDNVAVLPVWKKCKSAAENLEELATLARLRPHQFAKLIVIFAEDREDGIVTRDSSFGLSTFEMVGMLEERKMDILERTKRVGDR